jgi:serine/threonine-protein kinase
MALSKELDRPPTEKVSLEVVDGPHQGVRFEFDQYTTFIIGRGSTAHLRLPQDAFFSRHHCVLELSPSRCFLRDLGSRNGTYLNGAKVKEAVLKEGDVISGGKTRIRLQGLQPFENTTIGAVCCGCGAALTEPITVRGDPATATHPLCTACRSRAHEPPREVPGYEALQQIGTGGMGVVYLARHAASGEQVALKLIVPESAGDERNVRLFLREMTVLSQLQHPRIVRFREAGYVKGRLYFAMDYVPGVPLFELLDSAAPEAARVRLACGILCQALEALDYAHGRGFIHRDIKPSNLLVARHGRKVRVHLADFGLAKNCAYSGLTGVTHQGELRGSLPYMAPEQVCDYLNVGPAADLYSAGGTLYKLLSGHTPHDFKPGVEALLVLIEKPIVPLRKRCPTIPAGLAAVVERALAREPKKRFASAADMRRHLLPFARRGS